MLSVVLALSVAAPAASLENTICGIIGSENCSISYLSCLGVPDTTSWLNRYISTVQKICRCVNTTMAGTNCETPCPGTFGDSPCNGRGECWFPNATCSCDTGYKGKTCAGVCPRTFGNVCAGKGTCTSEGDDGASCFCFPGFRGTGCNLECAGGAARPCNARGVCELDASCTCVGGWRGPDCALECPGTNLFPCTLHGKCTIDAKCECDSLYRGDACEYQCPDVLGIPCGARGICNATGQCECNDGYRGTTCMDECPGGAGNPCGGHGVCNATGACACSEGWAGAACRDVCPGGRETPCGGNGKCVTNDDGSLRCECFSYNGTGVIARFEGDDCSDIIYNSRKMEGNGTGGEKRESFFRRPEVWPAVLPPLGVFLAIVAVFLSRTYTQYQLAVAAKIAELDASLEKASTAHRD